MSPSKIIQINTDYGRFYQTPDGIFPSVTTVLGSVPSPELDAWKAAVGEDKAREISRLAALKGTRLHDFAERTLKGEVVKLDPFDRTSFKSIIPYLKEISPIFTEKGFWSKRLRVAGTIDCFGKFRNKIRLIDFKTTSREKWDGDFDSYWLQCAAYSEMIFEHTNKKVDDLMILMQNLSLGSTEVFFSQQSIWLPKFEELRNNFKVEYRG